MKKNSQLLSALVVKNEIAHNLAFYELQKQIEKKGQKVHLVIYKDFPEFQIPLFELPEFTSFYKFTTQPNMLFNIKEHWHTFDDYVSDLNKKYRDQFKRARKKSEGITKRKFSLEDIENYKDRIVELYLNVAEKAPFNTFFLNKDHFEIFKKSLNDKFLFYGYFKDETLIGFNTLIKNGNDIDTYFLGYDEKCQRERMLYLNMLYDMIAYSINKGLWGTSVGGKETLHSKGMLPESAWPTQMTKEGSTEEMVIRFEKGEINKVNGQSFAHPIEAIQYIQSIAGAYGIGRDIHVGDTIIGIKGRVGFEAAAPMVILKAHHALEKHVLTKWQLSWKDQLASFYGNWLHEGQILDPVMRDIEAFLKNSQEQVTGDVFVQLNPYHFQIIGIESEYDLMSAKFGKYGEMNTGFTGADVRGFTKIFGNQTSIFHNVKESNKK